MVNFFSPNTWQMMSFLNPLDALIPKMPFSFFADFWVWVTSGARVEGIGLDCVATRASVLQANKEVDTLRHELANYEKDKMSLKNTRSRLLVLEDQFKKLEETHTEACAMLCTAEPSEVADDEKTSLLRFCASLLRD